jgi:hypothetical protein
LALILFCVFIIVYSFESFLHKLFQLLACFLIEPTSLDD